MKIIPYITKDSQKYDGIEFTETRYFIADDNGKIIDDANGYGYKSIQNANKAMWYKFKGGKEKIEKKESERKKFFKEHPGLKNYIYNLLMNNIKEMARGEVTDKDILEDIKREFGIDMPKEYLEFRE